VKKRKFDQNQRDVKDFIFSN